VALAVEQALELQWALALEWALALVVWRVMVLRKKQAPPDLQARLLLSLSAFS
jgi:hypothetical protein